MEMIKKKLLGSFEPESAMLSIAMISYCVFFLLCVITFCYCVI